MSWGEGNIVNEAGCSDDPGGITTHSSLISGKASRNLTPTDLINAPHLSLAPSSPVFSLCLFSRSDECRVNQ